MHYYKRNLGDYAKKAGRLSMLQHGAYTLLLDACYDREEFPTEEQAIEWAWASTPEEEQAVRFVLSRFFILQEDKTYVQTRVYEELQVYKIGEIQNRLIALAREARKQKRDGLADACDQLRAEIKNDPLAKTHAAWTGVVEALIKEHEAPPNHKPLTINQEPIKDIKKSKPKKDLDFSQWPEQPDESLLDDYKKLRKAKRAPLTQNVIDSMTKEFLALSAKGITVTQALQICVKQGWQGLTAQWVINHLNSGGIHAISQRPASRPDRQAAVDAATYDYDRATDF